MYPQKRRLLRDFNNLSFASNEAKLSTLLHCSIALWSYNQEEIKQKGKRVAVPVDEASVHYESDCTWNSVFQQFQSHQRTSDYISRLKRASRAVFLTLLEMPWTSLIQISLQVNPDKERGKPHSPAASPLPLLRFPSWQERFHIVTEAAAEFWKLNTPLLLPATMFSTGVKSICGVFQNTNIFFTSSSYTLWFTSQKPRFITESTDLKKQNPNSHQFESHQLHLSRPYSVIST